MRDRYAVVGNPVAHSRSPQIHAEFARATGQDLDYGRIEAPLDGFERTVEEFRGQGGKGLNVTVPFKQAAFRYCRKASWRAQAFSANRQMPPNFRVLIDPDYAFTLAYGLRWNAPQETAYPATFVLDPMGTVRFVRVSREHGDRVPAAETIEVLAATRHMPGRRQPSKG